MADKCARAGSQLPWSFGRFIVDGVEVQAGEPELEAQEPQVQGSRRFVLRYYSTFNTEQCELSATITEKLALPEQRQFDPIEACEKMFAGIPNPPEILHAGDQAFYSPVTDRVTMPPRSLFESADDYWSTLWHEYGGHAAGHPKRLNRESITEAATIRVRNLLRRGDFGGDDSNLSTRNRWHRKQNDRQLRRLRGRMAEEAKG